MVATRSITQGEVLFALPPALQLSSHNMATDVKIMDYAKVGRETRRVVAGRDGMV